ncbi:hypothetical protein EI969_02370 [Pseudomonas sp. PB101]|uniref:FAD-dependent monooxygenase n=1 Tax=Pseudomonas sp. PB101 TaxID=2495428 RepID=UPI0013651BC7|nr:hypothetical protein [Pseudomonas sp. PB101]
MDISRGVLIVGAGISGLTLAIALRLQGIAADVAEIKADVSEQLGVGLSLQGNALAAFGKIGLSQAMLRVAVPGRYLNMRKPDGTLLAHHAIKPMGGAGYPSTAGISRSGLHQILISRAVELGAHLYMGVTLDHYTDQADRITVTLSNGAVKDYDLVVGADGIYSQVRGKIFPEIKPRRLGQLTWRVEVPRCLGTFTSELHFGGEFGVVGICPITEDRSYLYLIEAKTDDIRLAESELPRLMREKLASYTSSVVQDALSHLDACSVITVRPLETVLVPDRWYRGRVIIIGDAAHSGPPVLAQGAAMGVEDAVVLAESLAQTSSVNDAFEAFMARRWSRASMVVNNSVQLCEWEVRHEATPQQVGQLMHESQEILSQPF